MTQKFSCDRAQSAVRALREVARRSDHVSVTRGEEGRAWASVASPDRSVLLELRLDDNYPGFLPPGGFVVTLGDLGDRPPARPCPGPWPLGVPGVVGALEAAGALGVDLRMTDLREMRAAASHAAAADDGRVHAMGIWSLAGGGAYATDGHRLVVPLRVHAGETAAPRAWLPAPLVRVLSRLSDGPADARALMPIPEDKTSPLLIDAWGTVEWDGGRAAFLADASWASYVPPAVVLSAVRHVRAPLDESRAGALQGNLRALEKTDVERAAIRVSGTGDKVYVSVPELVIVGSAEDAPGLGEPVHVNPRYLADAVRAVGPVREVLVGGQLDPVHVVGDERVAVIMPMRP